MAREVFRKTDAGAAALRDRASLEPRLRTMLILVNGKLAVEELQSQLGSDPRETLRQLRARGLIERVGAARPDLELPAAAPPAPTPVATPAAAALAPAPAPAAAPTGGTLREYQVKTVLMLRQSFGPWGDELAQGVVNANTLAEYRQALAPLQEKLSVYQGKKKAAELIAGVTPPA